MQTVDMTPTPEGFAAIGAVFARTILDDAAKGDRTRVRDNAALLSELVDIAFHLGRQSSNIGPEAAADLRDGLKVRFTTYLPR